MKLAGVFFAAFAIALLSSVASAEFGNSRPAELDVATLSNLTQWPVSSEKEPLVAGVIERKGITWLEIYRREQKSWNRIGEWEVGSFPLNMIVTTQMDGFLVTEWVTGSGYIFKIFEYERDRPKLILDQGAKGLPDLILSPTKDYEFALIMRTDQQGVAARGGPSDMAAIYKFKRGAEVKKTTTAWSERFQPLTH